MAQFDVFLSHSTADKPWVIKLKDDLLRYGVSAWLDTDEIRPGDLFGKALEQALDNSRAVALVVSPEAIDSGWVEEEYYRALTLAKNKQTPAQIIPVILRDAEVPGFLQPRNWVDFRDETTYAQSVWRLVWGITGEKPARVLDLTPPDVVSKEPSETASDRRIDAAVPSHAQVGQSIDLLVQVRFPDSPLLGIKDWPTRQEPSALEQVSEHVALNFPRDPRTGELAPAHLEIRVVAPDFEIEGETRKLIEVPPDDYSRIASFYLTATTPGNCRIHVEVYSVDDVYLGTIPIETAVGETPVSPTATVANLFLFVVVVRPEARPQPIESKIIRILRDPVWQGVAGVVAILALIAAVFTIPEARRIVGLERPTPLPTPTTYSIAAATPTRTPTATPLLELTPTPTPTSLTSVSCADIAIVGLELRSSAVDAHTETFQTGEAFTTTVSSFTLHPLTKPESIPPTCEFKWYVFYGIHSVEFDEAMLSSNQLVPVDDGQVKLLEASKCQLVLSVAPVDAFDQDTSGNSVPFRIFVDLCAD